MGLSTFRGDDQIHGFDYPASLRSACTKASSLSRPPLRRPSVNHNACLPTRSKWLEMARFAPWGVLNSQIRPSVSAGGVLHSRVVGIDVEVHLCSYFREAQHCGHFVCSLGGFLAAAAGVNTKPTPVRGSGSPRLPGSSPRVRGKPRISLSPSSSPGSSPRVRGKPHQQRHPLTRARLIPARAGKTFSHRTSPPPSRAHPRACGENRPVE